MPPPTAAIHRTSFTRHVLLTHAVFKQQSIKSASFIYVSSCISLWVSCFTPSCGQISRQMSPSLCCVCLKDYAHAEVGQCFSRAHDSWSCGRVYLPVIWQCATCHNVVIWSRYDSPLSTWDCEGSYACNDCTMWLYFKGLLCFIFVTSYFLHRWAHAKGMSGEDVCFFVAGIFPEFLCGLCYTGEMVWDCLTVCCVSW